MAFPNLLIHPSGRSLTLDPARAMLAFDPPGRPPRLRQALAAAGLVPEHDPIAGERRGIVNHGPRYYFVRSRRGEHIDAGTEKALRDALGRGRGPKLAWLGPVYRFAGTVTDRGLLAPVLDSVRLHLREARAAKIDRLLAGALRRAGLSVLGGRGAKSATKLRLHSDPKKAHSLEAVAVLAEAAGAMVQAYPDWVPLMSPAAATPFGETHWGSQWNMLRIGAEAAWDETKGDATVFLCVIDRSLERGHEELNRVTNRGFEASGLAENAGAIGGAVADITYPPNPSAPDAPHGTAIASIGVAAWDVFGVAGLAGDASLFALASPSWSAIEVEDAVDRARDLALAPAGGADKRVILLGGTSMAWAGTGVQTSISAALTDGILVCCPSGNGGGASIEYPGDGSHPEILVCGASDNADARSVSSSYGTSLSVVAPGEGIPVADLTGPEGYSAGEYALSFSGTSAGAAHTAGLGVLLLSSPNLDFASYPGASIREKLKSVIERTAEKVGPVVYNSDVNPRHDEMGFGRIRTDWALTLADVMIRDTPTDTGVEPSTGVFWRDSDIVARRDAELLADVTTNWDVWHADYNQSRLIQVKADMTPSYCYVRIRNLGPATATNVRVRLVAARCSTGFMYPTDWDAAEDADHIVMTPDPWPGDNPAIGDLYDAGDLAQGVDKIVRFQVSYAQGVKARDTWAGHACSLCRVMADNDHAFNQFAPAVPVGGEQTRRNNLVQRNLTAVTATSPWFFPFLASNIEDPDEDMELVIDAVRFPTGGLIRLALDDPERAFPGYLAQAAARRQAALARSRASGLVRGADASLTLLDRARFHVECGTAEGILTIEPGSRFDYLGVRTDSKVEAVGANVVLDRGKRVVETRGKQAQIRMKKQPYGALPLYLEIPVPPGTRPTDRFLVDVIQRNRAGEVMGGISLWLIP